MRTPLHSCRSCCKPHFSIKKHATKLLQTESMLHALDSIVPWPGGEVLRHWKPGNHNHESWRKALIRKSNGNGSTPPPTLGTVKGRLQARNPSTRCHDDINPSLDLHAPLLHAARFPVALSCHGFQHGPCLTMYEEEGTRSTKPDRHVFHDISLDRRAKAGFCSSAEDGFAVACSLLKGSRRHQRRPLKALGTWHTAERDHSGH